MPKISIIVPVYKLEKYIHQCVDSILAQSFTDFELILVDDGSPDLCGAICDDYARKDSRIRVIHKENGGLSSARNAGIEIARGEYLGFVDGDDYILPDMYEKLYAACQKHDVPMAACDALWIYEDANMEKSGSDGGEYLLDAEQFFLRMIDVRCFLDVTAWNKLYRRDLFEGVRYPVGKLYEDQGTTYKLVFRSGKVAYLSQPLYGYRKQRAGAITAGIYGKREEDRFEMTGEMLDYIAEHHPAVYRDAAVYRMITCHLSIMNAMVTSRRKDAQMYARIRRDIIANLKILPGTNIAVGKKLQIIAAATGYWIYGMFFRLLKG